jgi:hypothetical protein
MNRQADGNNELAKAAIDESAPKAAFLLESMDHGKSNISLSPDRSGCYFKIRNGKCCTRQRDGRGSGGNP